MLFASRILFVLSIASLVACSSDPKTGTTTEELDTEPCTHLPVCHDGDEVVSSFDPCIEAKTCYRVACGTNGLYCRPKQ